MPDTRSLSGVVFDLGNESSPEHACCSLNENEDKYLTWREKAI